MNKKFSVCSLFTGIGGLDLGFEQEGLPVVWANDLEQAATLSFRENFGREAILGDITEMHLGDIPSTDIVIGGPPCQSFSLVGKRRPDDPRGKLAFRYFEIVQAKRPTVFVMENVPGMAASIVDSERLPEFLTRRFEGIGYSVTQMKLNAIDFLVPQLRKRLFLIGSLSGPVTAPDPDLFARDVFGVKRGSIACTTAAALGDLGKPSAKGQRSSYNGTVPSFFAGLMRRPELENVSLHELPRMSATDRKLVAHIPPGGNYRDVPDEIATGRIMRFKATGGRTTTYGRLHPDRPSFTINTYFRRPNVGCNFHYSEPRLITPREAMRLQAIPDWFELTFTSQDQRNALIGNAVPSLLGRAVAWAVRRHLETSRLEQLTLV